MGAPGSPRWAKLRMYSAVCSRPGTIASPYMSNSSTSVSKSTHVPATPGPELVPPPLLPGPNGHLDQSRPAITSNVVDVKHAFENVDVDLGAASLQPAHRRPARIEPLSGLSQRQPRVLPEPGQQPPQPSLVQARTVTLVRRESPSPHTDQHTIRLQCASWDPATRSVSQLPG
jgi:hypothetical protein